MYDYVHLVESYVIGNKYFIEHFMYDVTIYERLLFMSDNGQSVHYRTLVFLANSFIISILYLWHSYCL